MDCASQYLLQRGRPAEPRRKASIITSFQLKSLRQGETDVSFWSGPKCTTICTRLQNPLSMPVSPPGKIVYSTSTFRALGRYVRRFPRLRRSLCCLHQRMHWRIDYGAETQIQRNTSSAG